MKLDRKSLLWTAFYVLCLMAGFLIGGKTTACIGRKAELRKRNNVQKSIGVEQRFFAKTYNYISKINKKLTEDEKVCIIKCVYDASKRYNRDPYLYLSLEKVESNFNPKALGKHGERGLWQIKLSTALKLSSNLFAKKEMKTLLGDIYFNTNLGSSYLELMIKRFDGNVSKGLQAYNCGASNVIKGKIPQSTFSHVVKIMDIYYELTKEER